VTLATSLKELADEIGTSTGIRTVIDPRQVVLPCILVNPPELQFRLNCGAAARVPVLLMSGGVWDLDALGLLGEMMTKVLAVEGLHSPSEAIPASYRSPDGGDVPAYQLTYELALDV
jgi:hypothetical protein